MNINSLVMKINNFNEYIVESGFIRDIQEYINTIAQPQNSQNLILLKDISTKVIEHLEVISSSEVPENILILIANEKIKPFTPINHIENMKVLVADSEIDTARYHAKLNQLLNNLKNEIAANQTEIKKVYDVIYPYYIKDSKVSDYAVISFSFKHHETISHLKNFYLSLAKINKALLIYHQLTSSIPPKDLELVNVQNGSIDVLLNIDVNVAINLTEIIKYALIAFTGYLSYKKSVKLIVESYLGNEKLIKSEKEREKLLLANIGETIKTKLLEQHNKLLKKDSKINKESVSKKIEEVSNIISEHIVKGNEIKLLIDFNEEDDENTDDKNINGDNENENNRKLIEETKKELITVRNHLKNMSADETKLLIDTYSIKEDDKEDDKK